MRWVTVVSVLAELRMHLQAGLYLGKKPSLVLLLLTLSQVKVSPSTLCQLVAAPASAMVG